MVSHKRCENAESQPAEHEILCGICAEATKISTGIQETAHVQGWKHMKVQKDMRPPGFVVTHPDTAVTVHADIGRRENIRILLSGSKRSKASPAARVHIVAEQVVYPVV